MAVISRLISSRSRPGPEPAFRRVELRVAEGGGGTGGESLEQLAVALVEDAVAGQLVGDLDRADGDAAG